MPIFEFECEKCGAKFERLVFASDNDPVECKECGSPDTRKVVSVFSCSGLGASSGSSCGSGTSGGFS